MSEEQYWIRNEDGRIWGPFALGALSRVDLGRGVARAQVGISRDGRQFKPLDSFPEVVQIFDQQLAARKAALERAAQSRAASRVQSAPLAGGAGRPAGTPEPSPQGASKADRSGGAAAAPGQEGSPGAVPREGFLEELSAYDLYSRVAAARLSGSLVIDGDVGRFTIAFRKGTPIAVSCPQQAAELAHYLARKNAAPTDALQAALAEAGPGGELVGFLISRQIIPPQDIFRHLGRHALDLLDRALSSLFGSFEWLENEKAPPGAFELGHRWALLAGSLRKLPADAARERLGARAKQAIYRSSAARVELSDLQLPAQELRMATLFDGTRSVEQIAADLPGEADTVYRTALLMAEIAFVSFGPELRASPKRDTPAEIDDSVLPAMERNQTAAPKQSASEAAGEGPVVGRVAVKAVAVRSQEQAQGSVAQNSAAHDPAATKTPVAPLPSDLSGQKPAQQRAAATSASQGTPGAQRGAGAPSPVLVPEQGRAAGNAPPRSAAATRPAPSAPRAPATSASPRPASKPAEPAGASAASSAAEIEECRKLLALWEEADHFKVLGVSRSVTPAEAKSAFFSMARKHHPDRVPAGQNELRKLKADITARVNEAHAVLSDPGAKAQYIDELEGGGQKVDVGHIFKAEEDFLRATVMFKARRYPEALELLEGAIELNPEEAEFYAWRGFVRFVSASEKRSEYERSVADCNKALAMSERCDVAHLFLGNMSKILGNTAQAEKSYRKVLELDPDNIEAQRELRLINSRR